MYIYIYNYHYLIKTTLCFIWFDQGEPRIRASNDGFIKLQTVEKISLSGLRIFFYFSRESSWLKWGYFVFIKSIKEGLILSVTLQSKKKWNSSSNVLQNLQFLWFQKYFWNGLVLFLSYDHLNEILSTIDDFLNFFHFLVPYRRMPKRTIVLGSICPSVCLSVRPSTRPSH